MTDRSRLILRRIGAGLAPIALVVTAIPCAWVGGKLFLARQPAAHPREALG
jgi:hypothetical protein